MAALQWQGVVPEGANPPRLFSPPHPDAVATLADQAVPWIEARRGKPLRWAQRITLERALEVNAAGEFCWREVLFLAPRRAGKSILLTELALWRACNAELFGERQDVIHLAKDLMIAREIQSHEWSWAAEVMGVKPRMTNGQEAILTPDGSRWQIKSHASVYGFECGLAVVDEAWAITEEIVDARLKPTQTGRQMPQLWFMSMPESGETLMVPKRRRMAEDVAESVMIAEWSAPAGADVDDLGVWVAAQPHVDEFYLRDIREACRRKPAGFRQQWLGQWRELESVGQEWITLEAWAACAGVVGEPRGPVVAAVEQSLDGDTFGVAVGWLDEAGKVRVRAYSTTSLPQALGLVSPDVWLAPESLRKLMDPHLVSVAYSQRDTPAATQRFKRLVTEGGVRHDGADLLATQLESARVTVRDSGPTLSPTRSVGDVSALKCAVWVSWHLTRTDVQLVPEAPAVW